MNEATYPAKIISPVLSDVLLRERLFHRIDELRDKQIIWISGPGGAGKTALVSSYIEARKIPCIWYQVDSSDEDLATFFYYLGLAGKKAAPHQDVRLPHFTPEFLLGVPDFSRYFFTELSRILKTSSFLVFDNCQEIPDNGLFFSTILAAQTRMDSDMTIVFISRNEAAPVFTRQKANREMGFIGWEELRLTTDEFNDLAKQYGLEIQKEQLHQMYNLLDGWAAGLQLMTSAGELDTRIGSSSNQFGEESRESIFAYFAEEIFGHLDKDSRDTLLKTSLLPYIDASLAEQVCGTSKAFEVLKKLYRSNIFITQRNKTHRVYQYHQLFREFLMNRCANTLSADSMNRLRSVTAHQLIKSGQIEEAGALFVEAQDWQALGSLITAQAPVLFKQGRFQTLGNWLRHVPDSIVFSEPWLLFWAGMCLMLQEPEQAREYFNQALERFEEHQDITGIFLTMCGFGESLAYRFDSFILYDQWIEKLETICSRCQGFPSTEIEARVTFNMLIALGLRQPSHPDSQIWRNRAVSLLDQENDIGADLKIQLLNPLILERISSGALPEAEFFIHSFKNLTQARDMPPLALITLKNFEALFHWRSGNPKKCYTAVNSALELAAETGIHVISLLVLINGTSGALSDGDLTLAETYLEQIEAQLDHAGTFVKQLYHISKVWKYLLGNNQAQALVHGKRSLHFAKLAGNPEATVSSYLGYAIALQASKRYGEAQAQLENALAICNEVPVQQVEFGCRLVKAEFTFCSGNEKQGLLFLEKALVLGRQNDYYNFPIWRPLAIAELCIKALETGIEVEYVRRLITRRHLNPVNPPVLLENWPWPLRIYCFGRFEIVREGTPLQASRKARQKPLELLKLLIALGGRNVSVSLPAETLWPEADGDMQNQSFHTTLHRLRKLLGIKDAIILKAGELNLNMHCCWVDIRAFEQMARNTEKPTTKEEPLLFNPQAVEKAITLYKGAFLHSEKGAWAVPNREILHSKFVQVIEKLGQHYFLERKWLKAIDCYHQGIKSAPLVENFYHQLMLCYIQTGHRADALQLYQQYRKIITSSLGIHPSIKIEKLYQEIKSEK